MIALGQVLYTRFLFPFEIAGLILLVAMIGAIVLTHRSRRDTRPQKVWKQIARRPQDSVDLIDPAQFATLGGTPPPPLDPADRYGGWRLP